MDLLDFRQVVKIPRGHEESSGLKRLADKGIRSQVGSFSIDTEHSCKGWVLFADFRAVNYCDSQLVCGGMLFFLPESGELQGFIHVMLGRQDLLALP